MTQQERAKLFMPFDAMKGLQEELRKREEKHMRVDKIELSEESQQEISDVLCSLEEGMDVSVRYYSNHHYLTVIAKVVKLDFVYKYLYLTCNKIRFDDLYQINIL